MNINRFPKTLFGFHPFRKLGKVRKQNGHRTDTNGWVQDKMDQTNSNQRRTIDVSPVRYISGFEYV